MDLSLYLVTDPDLTKGRSLIEIIEEAIAGGVTMVQIREKDATSLQFYNLAKAAKQLLAPHNIPLIINDRLDIALAVDADGLHIGQSDLPPDVARKLLGKDKILGWSVETIEQAIEANDLDVDYIGISPIFSTTTKTDINKPFELEGARKVVELTNHPTVAIGGISTNNLADVMKTGVDGVAVVSAIISHQSPKDAAREMKKVIDLNKK